MTPFTSYNTFFQPNRIAEALIAVGVKNGCISVSPIGWLTHYKNKYFSFSPIRWLKHYSNKCGYIFYKTWTPLVVTNTVNIFLQNMNPPCGYKHCYCLHIRNPPCGQCYKQKRLKQNKERLSSFSKRKEFNVTIQTGWNKIRNDCHLSANKKSLTLQER